MRRTSLYPPSCSPDHMRSSVNYCRSIYMQFRYTNDPKFTAAVTEWQSRAVFASVQQPLPTEQRIWDEPLVNVQVSNVLSAALDQRDKARLIAAAAPHSRAFLHARPCSSLGTRLDNSSLRIAIALRIGAPVCLPHVCVRQTRSQLSQVRRQAVSS